MSYATVGKYLKRSEIILPQILREARQRGLKYVVGLATELSKDVQAIQRDSELVKRTRGVRFPVTGFAKIERVLSGNKREYYDLETRPQPRRSDIKVTRMLTKKVNEIGGTVEKSRDGIAPIVLYTSERQINEEELTIDGVLPKYETVLSIGKRMLNISPLSTVLTTAFSSSIRSICIETNSKQRISSLAGPVLLNESGGLSDCLDIYTMRCVYRFTNKTSTKNWYTIGVVQNASSNMLDKKGKPPVHLDDLLSGETNRGILHEMRAQKSVRIHCVIADIGHEDHQLPPSSCNAIITSNSWTAGEDDMPLSVFSSLAINTIGAMGKTHSAWMETNTLSKE
eukprot:TRINITY_DN17102_c0_g1_i1.p1 TRINITY_DN17102_c0_g1~~TRINITY_DN17102_c0_g1_i1.p1  ORF type:complete len:350 (+),score=56.13 TRINITY_DN17102_c0_g1_i1:33-1052(+)